MLIDGFSADDITEILSNISAIEDFSTLLDQINDMPYHGLNFNLPEGRLVEELCKCRNITFLKYTIDYVEKGKSQVDRWKYEFYAELIRYACEYDWLEALIILHDYGLDYSEIRNECYQWPNQGDGLYDEDTSSPLAFAIDANSIQCYLYLLRWMEEEGESIEDEGTCTWEGWIVRESISSMLKRKGLAWPLRIK